MNDSRILQQGVLDGFCLLYAVANAYKTLMDPDKSALWFMKHRTTEWRKIVSLAPSLQNLACGIGSNFGLQTKDANAHIKRSFIDACLTTLQEGRRARFEVETVTLADIAEGDFTDTVYIVCLLPEARCKRPLNLDHWVCCIDRDEDDILLACSYTAHLYSDGPDRLESTSPSLKRPFNNAIALKDLTASKTYPHQVYRISKSDR